MKNIKTVWNESDDISDKILLVFSDCTADTLKYCFLLKELQKKAKKLIFLAQSETFKLLKINGYDFDIFPSDTDLNTIEYDCYINLKDVKSISPQENFLDVNPQDFRLFRAQHVCDHRKFKVGLGFSEDIPFDLFKIYSKLKDIHVYLFMENKHEPVFSIFDWSFFTKDLYNLSLAIKCMHLIISNNEIVINLAGAMGKSVFALYKKEKDVNNYAESIKSFVNKEENRWDDVIAQIKPEIEYYRINLREKYLLACMAQVDQDISRSKISALETKATILAKLFFETQNNKYLLDFITTEKELYKRPKNHLISYYGNIATFLAFHTIHKKFAKKMWDKVICEIKPEEHPDFMFNYACLQCSEGNFEDFIKYYDYRFLKKLNPTPRFKVFKPAWDGEKNVSDKVLLITFEQGYGDTFLFSKYLDKVQKLFKEVIFVVQHGTQKVLHDSFPDVKVFSNREVNIDNLVFDYHISLLSLGKALNITPDKIKRKKWLTADKKKVKEFKKYFSKKNFNVGIFWESSKTNLQRYTDLKTLVPLGNINKVQLYSLHIEKEDFELNYIDKNINIKNIGKYFNDFSDTAAAIQNCDLIVSTDSSVLNLAGALGKKTFGLFNQFPEWRWYKLDGEDVGWFKTVKPFKSENKNDFSEAIKLISSEIEDLIRKNDRFKK